MVLHTDEGVEKLYLKTVDFLKDNRTITEVITSMWDRVTGGDFNHTTQPLGVIINGQKSCLVHLKTSSTFRPFVAEVKFLEQGEKLHFKLHYEEIKDEF